MILTGYTKRLTGGQLNVMFMGILKKSLEIIFQILLNIYYVILYDESVSEY